MQIGVIGINHKLATLALRESLVRGTLRRLKERCSHHLHYIYLATCNRVEIYFSSKDLVATHSQLLQLLCEHVEEEIAHKFYSYFREDCFLHLAKVTTGLDSAILFETEIQGQVKRAYEQAALESMLCPEMHFLFQKSLSIGKKIRSLFPKGRGMESLEEAIARVSHSFFGSLTNRRLLFVGLSEINRKIAHYFENLGVGEIVFCNRSLDKGALLKGRHLLFGLDHLIQWYTYDMTLFGTSCPDYLLQEGVVLEKQHLMIDLSVPRNVHPRLGKVSKLTLLNVEQIDKLIDRRCKNQSLKISKIESDQVSQAVHRCLEQFFYKTIILN
jgi:glutamyl-tRNA reductase